MGLPYEIDGTKPTAKHAPKEAHRRTKIGAHAAAAIRLLVLATLSALKRFFAWLAGQPGYKSRISYSDADYFNLSAKETRIAKAHRDARVPTLEQIRHVIRTMPASTEIERRDRALIALTILTGARDGAIASLKLKHIDIDQGRVDQDAREVKTKSASAFSRARRGDAGATAKRYSRSRRAWCSSGGRRFRHRNADDGLRNTMRFS